MVGNSRLRLTSSTSSNIGRLEVFHEGNWGAVCDDDFTNEAAAVFCKSLGLPYANAAAIPTYGFDYSLPILLDQVTCQSALDARYCRHDGWEVHNCDRRENSLINAVDSFAISNFPTNAKPFASRSYPLKIGNSELRLAGGTSRRGRLEVYHAGEWGTVCDDDFTDEYAAVICKSLGLPFGNAREIHNFGGGTGKPIHLDQVNCAAATHARHCVHAGWGVNNCQHGEDLGIHCQ
ncbi:hypothetical protein CAPTEDRAFT_172188 [Capitella teleta]|uniref:SRCR domain-containing protein n=1 Tax=Capitella teleta TaxID=283909 RepID=X1ZCM9_CAPTE|nr:hypothetical protein CAPTEDRAFT_172188 [Capitella teleta]|eukprot:ELT88354.1 hypothetical protein CAPTEDRAFT_172188 [Capitella teleta]